MEKGRRVKEYFEVVGIKKNLVKVLLRFVKILKQLYRMEEMERKGSIFHVRLMHLCHKKY
jgi:hypothetical protein